MFTYAPVDCESFQAMRLPTGFTNDNSYIALDVDVWSPDVVAVSVCVGVLLFGVGGGGWVFV